MQFVEIPMKLVATVLQSEFVVSTQRFLCVYRMQRSSPYRQWLQRLEVCDSDV